VTNEEFDALDIRVLSIPERIEFTRRLVAMVMRGLVDDNDNEQNVGIVAWDGDE
jgi:hypothetical protein